MTENPQIDNENVSPAPVQRSTPRRIGCWIMVVVWFALLVILPCFCIALVINQEIVIPTGSVPGQQIRVWLIMEIEARGVGVSSASAIHAGENNVCVETQTNFLLWTGSADPVQSCECYERSSLDDAWELTSVNTAQCAENAQE